LLRGCAYSTAVASTACLVLVRFRCTAAATPALRVSPACLADCLDRCLRCCFALYLEQHCRDRLGSACRWVYHARACLLPGFPAAAALPWFLPAPACAAAVLGFLNTTVLCTGFKLLLGAAKHHTLPAANVPGLRAAAVAATCLPICLRSTHTRVCATAVGCHCRHMCCAAIGFLATSACALGQTRFDMILLCLPAFYARLLAAPPFAITRRLLL